MCQIVTQIWVGTQIKHILIKYFGAWIKNN